MKHTFSTGATQRARTRALLCVLTLALLCITVPSKAQIWGTEATSGAGVNISATFDAATVTVTTHGSTKWVSINATNSSGNKVWFTLVLDGTLSLTGSNADIVNSIPLGTYPINNSETAGTALASKGLTENSSSADIIGTGGRNTNKFLHATAGTIYVFETNDGNHNRLIYLQATDFHQPISVSVQAEIVPSGKYNEYTYANSLTSCGSGSTETGSLNVFSFDYNITAIPSGSASFVEWRDGDGNYISADNPYTFTAWGPEEVVAIFSDGVGCPSAAPATPTYEVACTVSPAGAGTVTGDGTFDEGTDVTLTATPANRRYQFSHWTDEGSSTGTDGVNTYNINDIAADHNNVVAVFTEVPVTLADNEETAYYTATASTFTGSMDFQLMRTFYAGMWNTVCFPFDLTDEQRAESGMSGATFYTLTSVTGDASVGLDFNVAAVTTETMTARTPYLVRFDGADIVNPVFTGVTLATSAFTNNTGSTNEGETQFFGTVHPTSLEVGQNSGFLFLGQNDQLYWPNVANDIRAFRAYFYSGNSTVQAVHPRARIVVRGETPTEVETIDGKDADGDVRAPSKYLQNGNLVIERDGKRYNAVGQVVK